MILKIKGNSINIQEELVKVVTRFKYKINEDSVFLCNEFPHNLKDFDNTPIITTSEIHEKLSNQVVSSVKSLEHLSEGDVVLLTPNGRIRTLYRVNANMNAMLVTERCNSFCLMCSQPPKDKHDIEYYHEIHKKLIPLIPKNCPYLGITGGEPTIMGDLLFELLTLLKEHLPSTEIHMLTNGRAFAINKISEKLSLVNHPRLMLGIPVYSDFYQDHDYVVQSKNAFYQTLMGINNLKRYSIRIEIRVVLHKLTFSRLENLSEFIFLNLPFVDHVAFMGLEITGFTKPNLNKLWIDPVEYMPQLENSVHYLDKRKIRVSIYNTPLCLLPDSLWDFSRKSISDWKNIYHKECSECDVLEKCGGFFASSDLKHSQHIRSIHLDNNSLTVE